MKKKVPEARLGRSERKKPRQTKRPHPLHHIHVSIFTSGRNCRKTRLAIPRAGVIDEQRSFQVRPWISKAVPVKGRAGGRWMGSTRRTLINVEIEVTLAREESVLGSQRQEEGQLGRQEQILPRQGCWPAGSPSKPLKLWKRSYHLSTPHIVSVASEKIQFISQFQRWFLFFFLLS